MMKDEDDDSEYFTLVFKGDLRAFKGNPLKTETVFGVPMVASLGDATKRADELQERLDNIESAAMDRLTLD